MAFWNFSPSQGVHLHDVHGYVYKKTENTVLASKATKTVTKLTWRTMYKRLLKTIKDYKNYEKSTKNCKILSKNTKAYKQLKV